MKSRKDVQGSVAVEFSLVLPVFLGLVYALVSYALVFMLNQSFTYASEDALRAALAVDCQGVSSSTCVSDRITPAVRTQVVSSLSWLPADVRDKVLGSSGERVDVSCTSDTCTVEVTYPNYRGDPLLPLLNLPLVGTVPRVPQDLVGRASLRV